MMRIVVSDIIKSIFLTRTRCKATRYSLFFMVILWSGTTLAQTSSALKNAIEDTPFEIESASGIEWQPEANMVRASGAVRLRLGEHVLQADTVAATWKKDTPTEQQETISALERLTAEGHVVSQSPDGNAGGDSVVYEAATGRLMLQGSPAFVEDAKQRRLQAKTLVYNQSTNRLLAQPNATIATPTVNLDAETIEAFFKADADKKTTLERAVAKGSVVVRTATERLLGDAATYEAATGIAVLTGATVRLERGKSYLVGNRADINMNTGISTMHQTAGDGRVRGQIVPASKNP
ncbi:MAG: LptA/OstA family protein [Holosporales bacterium]